MKRVVILVLAFAMFLCSTGCAKGGEVAESTATTENTVVPTESVIAVMTPEVTVPEATEPPEPVAKPEPEIPGVWTVNAVVSVSFFSYPDGTIVGSIPAGSTVEVLGWTERYAKVNYEGREGYVLAGYLMPGDSSYMTRALSTVRTGNLYTYWDMVEDIRSLKKQYPTLVTTSSLGTTELGRDIPMLCIGNLDAEYHVLIQGAIHGREHLTAWVVMAMADYWLGHGIWNYGDVCYHIIPMVNPDGVIISQTQTLNDEQKAMYATDRAKGYTVKSEYGYAQDWKANGKGVDLNRSFPSGWDPIDDRDGPSSERYKGIKPFSAVEAIALRDYTYAYDFDATISYHSSGSIIYYEYGKKEPVNSQSKALGLAVSEISGYRMANSVGVGGAGYKDWAMDELGIPSLTIEIGSGDSPLNSTESYSTFVRNIGVLPAIATWLQE